MSTTTITTTPAELAAHYDVVIVGSGAAGMIAANRAADAGLTVAVLEKATELGGTTAVSGGVMWAPVNRLMLEAGYHDSQRQATDYLRAGTPMTADEIEWYLRNSAAAVDYLDRATRVRYQPLSRPDYHPEWRGATEGRGLDSEPFQPGDIPGLSEILRRPTYLPLISMAERDALGGAPIDPELLAERAAAGIRTMGGALIGALIASAVDRGITIAANARVDGLTPDSTGWQIGVGGRHLAADSVVLASGGFEWAPHMRRSLLKFDITPISAPSNEGDGLALGVRAGASVASMTSIWGVPVIAPPTQHYDGLPSGRMGNVEMTLPGSFTVNAAGRRFVNEALNYHDLNRVFGNVDPVSGLPANVPAWLVFDADYLSRYPVGGAAPDSPQPWMTTASSLAELAEKCGIAPDQLQATADRFNSDARAGRDTEFGRGHTEQDRHLGDPTRGPNPCLAPVENPPYYAIPIHPGALGTAGGIRVNIHGQALDDDNRPIGGLYAAGNCSASAFHDAYPGGGATLGSAITRGYSVAEHLARPRNGRDRSSPQAAPAVPLVAQPARTGLR